VFAAMIEVIVWVTRAVDPPAPVEPDADRDALVAAPALRRVPPPAPDASVGTVVVVVSGAVVSAGGVVSHGTMGALAMVVVVVDVDVVDVVVVAAGVAAGVVFGVVSGVVAGVVSGTVVVVVVVSAGTVVVVAEQSSSADALLTGKGVDDPVVLAVLFDVGVLAEMDDGVELELVSPSIR
jgi:hypothetical protein